MVMKPVTAEPCSIPESGIKLSGPVLILLLMTTLYLAAGCTRDHLSEANYEEAEFADFVEPDFPFITTSLDITNPEEGFPEGNMAPRCLALQLGHDAYACFDTDLLRWSAAWSGDFLPMVTMAQVSYHEFSNKNNQVPRIPGELKIATGRYPGWMGEQPEFSDPRRPAPNPLDPPSGALSSELGRWNGLYLTDDGVVLSYRAGNSDIFERPGAVQSGGQTGFTRSVRIESTSEPLTMTTAEVTDAVQTERSDHTLLFYRGAESSQVTAVGLVGAPEGVSIEVFEERYAVVRVAEGLEDVNYSVVLWSGSSDSIGRFEDMLSREYTEVDITGISPKRWEETVYTRGQVAPDTAAYVVDHLTLPVPNPWRRNVRVTDLAFFEDGRAAVVTFEGDIWLVSGINEGLNSLKWNRYASGLYETQSIEIVDDTVYTFGRDGIIRFHDRNGDGEADYYENFSNLMDQSMETREWAFDFAADPEGGFYVAKGGALDMGPRVYTEPTASGFRGGSHHSGVILKTSADGREIEQFASGLRGPYLSVNPETGAVTASDQQGHWVPSTPILLVNEDDYFGVSATAHRDPVPTEITPPLLWIPHDVDRSGTSQVWITSDDMGPLSGGLVHISYGRPGLFSVLIDSTSESVQGAVSVIPGEWPAPVMKGAIHPDDGQLYVGGFNLWDSNSTGYSTLLRLRYTGQPDYKPSSFQAREGGIIVNFSVELNEESVSDPSNFSVSRWDYQRSAQYGSGRYRTDGTPGQEMLPVFSSHLSDDGRSLFLAVPNMGEVMQMDLGYQIEAADGTQIDDHLYLTVNDVEEVNLTAEGFSGLNADELLLATRGISDTQEPAEALPVSAERGAELFRLTGCMGCHTVDGTTDGMRGPSLNGLIGKERQFEDGSTLVADENYLREKILQPGERTLEGYDQGMPSFEGILTDSEIESIITWLVSLESE